MVRLRENFFQGAAEEKVSKAEDLGNLGIAADESEGVPISGKLKTELQLHEDLING